VRALSGVVIALLLRRRARRFTPGNQVARRGWLSRLELDNHKYIPYIPHIHTIGNILLRNLLGGREGG
jgi:hypothetical protein